MEIKNQKSKKIFSNDQEFDQIYPEALRLLSAKHFTEIRVAEKAAQLLVSGFDDKILDIGCGCGKFCFVAGSTVQAQFTGVDYRKYLIDLCNELTLEKGFENVNFIHSDIIDVDFKEFDHFYFFNPFEEHATKSSKMDDVVATSYKQFLKYSQFVRKQFEGMRKGTRVVTYFAYSNQMPPSYELQSIHFDGTLKCWQKIV